MAAVPPTGVAPDDSAAAASFLARQESLRHLALVPTARIADISAAIGWTGTSGRPSACELSAVLRSWEERFGARLVGLGHARALLSVAARPDSSAEARRLALEHCLVCPDAVEQSPDTFDEYADGLLHRRVWSSWWD